jgi:hypothetical protein
MAPVDDPQIVVAVVMDEPRVGARDGGQVSAPVFREVAQQILAEMNVPRDPSIKPTALVAAEAPKTPDEAVIDKNVKSVNGDKDKPAALPEKEKPKPPKKTNDKRLPEPGKLTAETYMRERERPYRNKVET